MERRQTAIDRWLTVADNSLRTIFGQPTGTGRPSPSDKVTEEPPLSAPARAHAAGLMRVNHAGEIAAQALYQGQALTARSDEVRQRMAGAADEENDHLRWCEQRLQELGSHTSRLAPLWYGGSFSIGVLAGMAGDRWSLGFVAETEKQVVDHLSGHLQQLPPEDRKSRAIVEQMRIDEAEHGTRAMAAGGAVLPRPIRKLMAATAKIMTTTAYYI